MSEPQQRVRILLSGATGRMGRTVASLAARDEHVEVIGGVDREPQDGTGDVPRIVGIADAGLLLPDADVVIDFSAPAFLRTLLETDGIEGVALVSGTTGLGDDEQRLLDRAAGRTAVLTAPNFSVGITLLLDLVRRASRALGPEYDIEIVEVHHRRKEDAPSGTALALGRAAAEGREVDLEDVRRDGRSGRTGARPSGEFGFHALRGGDIIGDHTVHLIGERERIELTHRASDRALFAAGALRAAIWLAGRSPGRYTMHQVLEL